MTNNQLENATNIANLINKKVAEQGVVKAFLEEENLEKEIHFPTLHKVSATIPDKIYRKMLEETLVHLNQEWIELQNDFNDL